MGNLPARARRELLARARERRGERRLRVCWYTPGGLDGACVFRPPAVLTRRAEDANVPLRQGPTHLREQHRSMARAAALLGHYSYLSAARHRRGHGLPQLRGLWDAPPAAHRPIAQPERGSPRADRGCRYPGGDRPVAGRTWRNAPTNSSHGQRHAGDAVRPGHGPWRMTPGRTSAIAPAPNTIHVAAYTNAASACHVSSKPTTRLETKSPMPLTQPRTPYAVPRRVRSGIRSAVIAPSSASCTPT